MLRTLVPAAAKIFRILAEHQLADEDGAGAHRLAQRPAARCLQQSPARLTGPALAGMTFPHMYRKCREKFLVTNEVALRSHLAEFRDHQLVASRHAAHRVAAAREPIAGAGLAPGGCTRRRNAEGADELLVPLDAEELQQLLDCTGAGDAAAGPS